MLYELYLSIKTELQKESFLKAVGWFNNQYDDGLVVETSAFIEFPDDVLNNLVSKDAQRVDLPFRVHYVKKVVAKQDGTIEDADIENFDTEAKAIVKRLKGFQPVDGNDVNITEKPTKFANIKSFQKQKGWQAWFIDFTVKINTSIFDGSNIPEVFTITTQKVGEGEIFASDSLVDIPKGKTIALSAHAATGYRFLNWLIDGVENLSNVVLLKASKSITAIANFIQQFTLAVNQPTNGTINTDEAPGLLDIDTEVTAELVPDEGYEGTILVNDVDSGETSVQISMTENKTLSAALQTILQIVQNILGVEPVLEGGFYYFPDTNGNKVKILNTPVLKLGGTNGYGQSSFYQVGGQSFDETYIVNFYDLANTTDSTFMRCGGLAANQKGFTLRYYSGDGGGTQRIYIYSSDGTTQAVPSVLLDVNKFQDKTDHEVRFQWSGIEGEDFLITIDEHTYSRSLVKGWSGNSFYQNRYGFSASLWPAQFYFKSLVKNDNSAIMEHHFQEQKDNLAIDISGNGNNLTLVVLPSDARDYVSDTAKPIAVFNGFTLFQHDGDSEYMIAPYDNNGQPTLASKTGYSKVAEVPAYSIGKGLINLYEWPDNATLIGVLTTEGVYDMHGNPIPLDFDSVKAISPSNQILKTETDNHISNITIKA